MPTKTKPPRHFTAHKLDKHRRLLAELPSRVEERQQSIHGRNQILAATQAYNLALEKRRVKAHISEMPGTIQRQIAQDYVGDLDKRIHRRMDLVVSPSSVVSFMEGRDMASVDLIKARHRPFSREELSNNAGWARKELWEVHLKFLRKIGK